MKKCTLKAQPKALVNFISKHYYKNQVLTAYEAGFSGFSVLRKLEQSQVANVIVHPAGVEISACDYSIW